MRARRLASCAGLAVALLGTALLAGCGGGGGGEGSYQLTAYFERAIGLYPHGDVVVMGIGVGTVDAVELEDTRVRVEMTIDGDVPLPDDVRATIEPQSLIGERNVHLFPPWSAAAEAAGQARIADGASIPLDRTEVPVEPDEGLAAFNSLAESLEPETVEQLVTDAAGALDGQGQNLAAAIEQASSLSGTFASLDQQLVGAAEAVAQLSATLNSREAQLQTLVQRFSEATGVLASERDAIATFLGAVVDLTAQGRSILDLYGDQLPADIANVTALLLVLDSHDSSIDQLLDAFPQITQTLADAYRPSIDGFNLVASPTPSFIAIYDNLLENLGLLAGG
jgi:phospholipid/cholesterol/gamma-HCH transport system substrate-binding protein